MSVRPLVSDKVAHRSVSRAKAVMAYRMPSDVHAAGAWSSEQLEDEERAGQDHRIGHACYMYRTNCSQSPTAGLQE